MPTTAEARDALAHLDASRAQLVRAANCPPERHLAFAALMAGVVVAPVFGPYQLLALVPVLIGIVLVIQWDRRRLGMFINGYRRGRTRLVVAPLLVVDLALVFASTWFAMEKHLVWPSLARAGLALVVSYLGSMAWQRVFARELGAAA